MSAPGPIVAEAALAAVGTRFRLHGRDVASEQDQGGLDCVGLAALALRAGGYAGPVPTGYPLRGGDADSVGAVLDRGLTRVEEQAPGDVLLMRSGPGQLHLAIGVPGGFVHADAGLRRVVARPGVAPWPVLGIWRL